MIAEWWHWAILGIGLILAELLVPAFVLIWFGLGALLVSLVLWLFPGMDAVLSVGLWLVAALALVFFWFRWFKSGVYKTRVGMSDNEVVGEIGLLVRAVAPFEKGQVRFQKPLLGADSWECIADEAIPGGERVQVTEVQGSLLKVARVGKIEVGQTFSGGGA